MASTPHTGVDSLYLNWVPEGMLLGGAILGLATGNPVFLGLGVVGLGIDYLTYSFGVETNSRAAWAIRPDSPFLKELNAAPMPGEIEYVSILGDARETLPRLSDQIFWHKGGDGAISLKGQRLSEAGVPNFSRLTYKEYVVLAQHMKVPSQLENVLVDALGLKGKASSTNERLSN